MTDWAVWPIFVLECLLLLMLCCRQTQTVFRLSVARWMTLGLLVVCVMIAASVYHDSSSVVHLYF